MASNTKSLGLDFEVNNLTKDVERVTISPRTSSNLQEFDRNDQRTPQSEFLATVNDNQLPQIMPAGVVKTSDFNIPRLSIPAQLCSSNSTVEQGADMDRSTKTLNPLKRAQNRLGGQCNEPATPALEDDDTFDLSCLSRVLAKTRKRSKKAGGNYRTRRRTERQAMMEAQQTTAEHSASTGPKVTREKRTTGNGKAKREKSQLRDMSTVLGQMQWPLPPSLPSIETVLPSQQFANKPTGSIEALDVEQDAAEEPLFFIDTKGTS